MKCNNCGNELSENAMFCDNCGQKVTEPVTEQKKIFCYNCGAEIKNGKNFCGVCGTPVNAVPNDELVNAVPNVETVKDEPEKGGKTALIIILLVAIIAVLAIVITVYVIYPRDNDASDKSTDTPLEMVTPTPALNTPAPTIKSDSVPTVTPNVTSGYITSDRTDLYNSSLTYKRMPDIHNTVLVDDSTFASLKNVIVEFEVQCSDYMNGFTSAVPAYLKVGSTAYNQQVEYKQKHPSLSQSYQSVDVINARQGGGYYYVWVKEVLNVTENGTNRTDTSHWVYKMENSNGRWYICDYTSDPAF